MVSVLVSSLSGAGSSPGRGHCVVFLGIRHSTLTVPLSTQAPVAQRLDNAIHRINRYPVDKC